MCRFHLISNVLFCCESFFFLKTLCRLFPCRVDETTFFTVDVLEFSRSRSSICAGRPTSRHSFFLYNIIYTALQGHNNIVAVLSCTSKSFWITFSFLFDYITRAHIVLYLRSAYSIYWKLLGEGGGGERDFSYFITWLVAHGSTCRPWSDRSHFVAAKKRYNGLHIKP